jgi:hypothetical protein
VPPQNGTATPSVNKETAVNDVAMLDYYNPQNEETLVAQMIA